MWFRKLILSCVIFLNFLLFFYPFKPLSAQEQRHIIAYIDSQRVVDESIAGKTALQALENLRKRMRLN